jgi:hypothetical protein
MWSIIMERLSGLESFWRPYFAVVPERIELPGTWQPNQLQFLIGTGIEESIPDTADQFRKHFAANKHKFELARDLSDSELERHFHFAGSLISAYSFTEDPDRVEDIAIVPLADILNHRTGCNNAKLFYGTDELRMVCVKDCPAGEQLFNTYGDLPNCELLLKYGFVDQENPFNVVSFDLEWLVEQLHSMSTLSAEKRVVDSEKMTDAVASAFFDSIPITINATEGYSLTGLKNLLDWVFMLTLPRTTSLKQVKPNRKYDDFVKAHRSLLVGILKSRLKLYPSSLRNASGVLESCPYGPERYGKTVVLQDLEMLNEYITFLEGPGVVESL